MSTTTLLLALVQATPPLGPHTNAWEPWFLTGENRAAQIERGNEIARILHFVRAASLEPEMDAASSRLQSKINDELKELDLDRLYELLGEHGYSSSSRRAFAIKGSLTSSGTFALRAADEHTRARQFGDIWAEIALDPTKPDAYLLDAGLDASLDHVTMDQVTAFPSSALWWLETVARGARSESGRGLDFRDRYIINELGAAYPETAELILRYVEIFDILLPSAAGARLHLRAQLDLPRIQKDWPRLAQRLKKLRGLFDIKTRILDGAGATVLTARFDSQHMRFFVDLWAHKGRILPRGRTSHPFDIATAKELAYTIQTNIDADLAGIEIYVEDLEVKTRFQRTRGFTSQFRTPPKIRVEGAAFGVVPVWLIDALIPSNIESMAKAFFERLTSGNAGRGVVSEIIVPQGSGPPLSLRTRAELLKNNFFTFGLQVAAWRVSTDEEGRREALRFRRVLLNAITNDFERERRRIRENVLVPAGELRR